MTTVTPVASSVTGRLLDVNLRKLRHDLENSRDYLFGAAGIPQDLYRPN